MKMKTMAFRAFFFFFFCSQSSQLLCIFPRHIYSALDLLIIFASILIFFFNELECSELVQLRPMNIESKK